MPQNRDQMKKRNRQMGYTLAGVGLAALLIFGGGAYLFTRAFTGHIRTVDEYETMQLEVGTYSSDLTAAGTIEAAGVTSVFAEVEGTVASIGVQEGDEVKEGDVLLNLKSDKITSAVSTTLTGYSDAQDAESEAKEQLSKAEAKLKTASKALTKAQKKLDNKIAEAEEAEEEAEDGNSKTIDLEPYEDAVESAQANVESAQDIVDVRSSNYATAKEATQTAKAKYEKAISRQEKLTVKASADGTISGLSVEKGSKIGPKSEKPAMKIVDMSEILCVVQIPESQVSNIVKGQTAVVTCTALPGEEFAAVVSRVSDVPSEKESAEASAESTESEEASSESAPQMGDAASNSTTYDVTLALDKASAKVKIGMAVTTQIRVQDYGTVYYVPATAVASNNAGMYVEAIVDSSTTKQYSVIQVGATEDGQLIIQGSSLSEGMTIRTDLSNGA